MFLKERDCDDLPRFPNLSISDKPPPTPSRPSSSAKKGKQVEEKDGRDYEENMCHARVCLQIRGNEKYYRKENK